MAQLEAIYGFKGLRIHFKVKKEGLFLSGYFLGWILFLWIQTSWGTFFGAQCHSNVTHTNVFFMSFLCLLYVVFMSDEKTKSTLATVKQHKEFDILSQQHHIPPSYHQ